MVFTFAGGKAADVNKGDLVLLVVHGHLLAVGRPGEIQAFVIQGGFVGFVALFGWVGGWVGGV